MVSKFSKYALNIFLRTLEVQHKKKMKKYNWPIKTHLDPFPGLCINILLI
jgi:hypothetical protein